MLDDSDTDDAGKDILEEDEGIDTVCGVNNRLLFGSPPTKSAPKSEIQLAATVDVRPGTLVGGLAATCKKESGEDKIEADEVATSGGLPGTTQSATV